MNAIMGLRGARETIMTAGGDNSVDCVKGYINFSNYFGENVEYNTSYRSSTDVGENPPLRVYLKLGV